MEEVSLAVNLLYTDAARPESQYVEQGKQLSKSTGEIGKAVEEFDVRIFGFGLLFRLTDGTTGRERPFRFKQ
jgi:hypothetical protein